MASTPTFEPIPDDAYEEGPVNLALREGHEPLNTLRLTARVQRKVEFLTHQIEAVIKHRVKEGTLDPATATKPRVYVSKIRIGFTPFKDTRGEDVVDKGYPGFTSKVVSKMRNPADLDLATLYADLQKAAAKSVSLGERLDAQLRHHVDVPDAERVPVWSSAVTSGPMGWTTDTIAERSFPIEYYEL